MFCWSMNDLTLIKCLTVTWQHSLLVYLVTTHLHNAVNGIACLLFDLWPYGAHVEACCELTCGIL